MVPRYRGARWLWPGGAIQPWIDALIAIDVRDDKKPLIELLRSNQPMPDDARKLIADLVFRKKLTGKRFTPAYDRSKAEMWLIWANDSVREWVEAGKPLKKAIELAASGYGVNEGTLCAYRDGKHSSARRLKKRRPPSAKPARS